MHKHINISLQKQRCVCKHSCWNVSVYTKLPWIILQLSINLRLECGQWNFTPFQSSDFCHLCMEGGKPADFHLAIAINLFRWLFVVFCMSLPFAILITVPLFAVSRICRFFSVMWLLRFIINPLLKTLGWDFWILRKWCSYFTFTNNLALSPLVRSEDQVCMYTVRGGNTWTFPASSTESSK